MKEEDFIRNITQKTKDLPIPDSISPDSMKQLLEETYPDGLINKETTDASTDKMKKKHALRPFTAVACAALCLAGTFGVSRWISNRNRYDFDFSTSSSDDTADGEAENEVSTDLVFQTNLISPSSYEEYYSTMKSAYEEYYNRLATVDTYSDESDAIYEESVADNAAAAYSMETADAASGTRSASKTDDFSSTNTQEQAVDEGDIIKTDGTYIYKVSSYYDDNTSDTKQRLTITKTENGQLTFLTGFYLDEAIKTSGSDDYINFHEFYLHNDRLVCMYSRDNYNVDTQSFNTYIVIYDLSDKKNPKKVKTLSQSGYYESSRISNGYLYTISNFSDISLKDAACYTDYIPCTNDKTIDCSDIYYPDGTLLDSTQVITSLNLENPSDFTDTKAVPNSGSQTYVSDSSIYLYATKYNQVTQTEILKINYADGSLTVGNTAVITGYLYDSFALNEYNGHLRIVATIPANNISLLRDVGFADDTATTDTVKEDVNALYILDENMQLTGKIAGIAPGETIYSARFLGDIGYFVTYKNTDPLFSVDLSDPANPVILGDLKVTGFSNYLHFYGDNTLLGIGEETDPATQEFLGLKLSMFNIGDPTNVTESDKYIIENSEFSDALYNHKAIMIDPEKNIFGFLYACDPMDDSWDFQYYYGTYTYDKEKGFIETARYAITDDSQYETDAVRGLYIGDYFYLATNKTITSYPIGSEEQIAQVSIK